MPDEASELALKNFKFHQDNPGVLVIVLERIAFSLKGQEFEK